MEGKTKKVERKIIHIDMDAFFASVEEKENPQYKNKPLIIGGAPFTRSVVATCNYEARKYGVHSGMSSQVASELCPSAIFVRPRISKYREISKQIEKILYKYTDKIEKLSLDEAYLEVTDNKLFHNSATLVARAILKDIYKQTSLTASAGVSYNKFLAKVASDYKKPNGITVVTPDRATEFIKTLKIRAFYGVGPVTEQRFKDIGIFTGSDLQKCPIEELTNSFGNSAMHFKMLSYGIDNTPLALQRERKSCGVENTFAVNLKTKREIYIELYKMLFYLFKRNNKIIPKTLTIKIKYCGFKQITRCKTTRDGYKDFQASISNLIDIVRELELEQEVRLVGVSLSNF